MLVELNYYEDQNFITGINNNTIYTFAKNGGGSGSVSIGELTATGHKLTEADVKRLLKSCNKKGTFEIE